MRFHIKKLLTLIACLIPSVAFAHGGHLGELAGHAHWVGVAAGLGVVGLLGLLAKGSKNKEQLDSDEADADMQDEPQIGEGETA